MSTCRKIVNKPKKYVYMQDFYVDMLVTNLLKESDFYIVKSLANARIGILQVYMFTYINRMST